MSTRQIFAEAFKKGQDNLAKGSEYWREQQTFHKISGNADKAKDARNWAEAIEISDLRRESSVNNET